jgi:pyruvate-ferredoxin/flavodoxin oxidoreductase
VLDSQRPRITFREYADHELRYRMLSRTNPAEAGMLMEMAQQHVNQTWRLYERAGYQGSDRRGSSDVHPDAGSATT